jgi:hypothetical protein
MRKKVKSFALEDGPYEKLAAIFKENYVDMGISYCVNRYIKEFVEYLQAVQGELQKDTSYTMPMSFIIETRAREPIFRKFDSTLSIKDEVGELQAKFNTYINKNPERPQELDMANLNDELQFTKLVQLLLKITWEEKKTGREATEDETRDLMEKIGGKDFLETIKSRVKPLAGRLENYDPDLGDLFDKIGNKLLNKKAGVNYLI